MIKSSNSIIANNHRTKLKKVCVIIITNATKNTFNFY